MFDWILFTIEGLGWNMGIQLQEVLEDLQIPVIFMGCSNSGLTDLKHLKQGKFDHYFQKALYNADLLQEFSTQFLPFTAIMDYCLSFWKNEINAITDYTTLEQLEFQTTYAPLKSIIRERIYEIDPFHDEDQTSLDDYF